METKVLSEEELNAFPKEAVIALYLQMAQSLQLISEQNSQLIESSKADAEKMDKLLKQVDKLQEQLHTALSYRFGRKTEKSSEIIEGQLFMDVTGQIVVLNEAEALNDVAPIEEKTDDELLAEARKREEAKRRKAGQRKKDLSFCEVVEEHYALSEEELAEQFPDGYVELKADETYSLEYDPEKLVLHKEIIHHYKAKSANRYFTPKHPKHLLNHSYMTPSLVAKIMEDKFINAIPYNRISKEFGWLDAVIRPSAIARRMIKLTDEYLKPVYEMMYAEIKKAKLIHCDETPFVCVEDRKKKGSKSSKSYMWVMHTADQYGSPPIFIYEYRDNRRKENILEMLDGYTGTIMADGYEPYHAVAKASNGLIVVAGCWAHAKRKFAEVIKADPKNALGTTAFEGNERIAKIYFWDNKMKDAPPEERQKYRQEKIKPLVDDFFKWAKERAGRVASEQTNKALQYVVNQEKYLRAFLDDPIIPLDNSDAERSIRAFCVGKHSWHIISASRGAEASGILYSIAETTRANGLKPYDYFKYLFDQLLNTEKCDQTEDFIRSIMPWSDSLPGELHSKKFKNDQQVELAE